MRDGSVVRRQSTLPLTWAHSCAQVQRWRLDVRETKLRAFADQARGIAWTPRLWRVLLDELHVSDTFDALVPASRSLDPSCYPHALAIALAERHSWTPADLRRLTRRLGVSAPVDRVQPTPRARTSRASPSGPRAAQRKES
jgi:5-methylcytosine-specific restriction endonuclease McrA